MDIEAEWARIKRQRLAFGTLDYQTEVCLEALRRLKQIGDLVSDLLQYDEGHESEFAHILRLCGRGDE